MNQILITCREALVAAVPLVPVFYALHRYYIHNRNRSLAYLAFAIYLSAMYAAVGLPDITYFRYKPHFNFVPFLYMFSAWETTLLNVLLFFPLGFFLTTMWTSFLSPVRTVLLGFCISLMVEVLQIFTYRASDINDLMTNTLGTLLGYLLGRFFLKAFPDIIPRGNKKDIPLVFGTAFGVMFFIYPFINKLIW